MPMSEEHKAKMAEGRTRWREDHAAELEQRKAQNKATRKLLRGVARGMSQTPEPTEPATPITETPEFQAAVAAAAQAAVAPLLERLANARDDAGTAAGRGGEDMAWARQLALALAEVSDQGTDRKRVAPEIMAKRERAARELEALLIEYRANSEQPIYQLKNKVQVKLRGKGETIIEPLWLGTDKIHYPTEIFSPDVPNLAMIPINDPAKRVYALFLESIGSIVSLEPENEQIAMTAGGSVVRGAAAAQVSRHLGAPSEATGWVGHDKPDTGFAEVRRNQQSQTKDVRVLGTLQPPARQNA